MYKYILVSEASSEDIASPHDGICCFATVLVSFNADGVVCAAMLPSMGSPTIVFGMLRDHCSFHVLVFFECRWHCV